MTRTFPASEGCTNPDEGKMILDYELDCLSPEDAERFDRHLMACDACGHELTALRDAVDVMDRNRDELIRGLRAAGAEFEEDHLRTILSRPESHRRTSVPRDSFFSRLFRWQVLAPAAIAVALFVFVIKTQFVDPTNPYLSSIELERLPYDAATFRGAGLVVDTAGWSAAMTAYGEEDFKTAGRLLEQRAERHPESEIDWLYLGVSRLMVADYSNAVEALIHARAIPDPKYNLHTAWYLAQGYLLLDQADKAGPLLDSLVDAGRSYAPEARQLKERIDAVESR